MAPTGTNWWMMKEKTTRDVLREEHMDQFWTQLSEFGADCDLCGQNLTQK